MRVATRAPFRVEFGGGGTDIPEFSDKYGGFTLNATINKYAYANLTPTHNTELKIIKTDSNQSILFKDTKDFAYNGDQDLIKAILKVMKINYGSDIYLRSDVPPDSGLGSGSTIATTMVGLFNHLRHKRKLNKYEVCEQAYDIMSKELGLSLGKQAFYSSVFGGFNAIEFHQNGFTRVNQINLTKSFQNELEKNMLLVYIGKREKITSQDILKKQQMLMNDVAKTGMLQRLKDLAIEMKDALHTDDIELFGNLINKAFETKKILNPTISNKKIEAINALAKKNGAIASRIQGAGGGGHMIILCEPNKEHTVEKKLQEKGIPSVPFSFTNTGLEVWESSA
jgi:D-glycero-alpha-D-manno-heptose-7-phosphate kinase